MKNYENDSVQPTRNELIQTIIASGGVPLLPFEFDIVAGQLDDHAEKQGQIAEHMTHAMSDTSETWHDNAAADLLRDIANQNTSKAHGLMRIKNQGVDFGYPDETDQDVTLGSVVTLLYPGDTYNEKIILTGTSRILPDALVAKLPEDTTAVTLSSPIGSAIIGSIAGGEVRYMGPHKELSVGVIAVQQFRG